MSVHVPPRIAPNASGINSLEGLIFLRAAIPSTTGRNIAVVVVFFMTAAQSAAENMISAVIQNSLSPAARCKRRPTSSITPVFASPPVRINRPAIVITMSLPKPAKASAAVSVLVRTSAITRRSATSSIGIRSVANRTTATNSRMRTMAIGVVISSRKHTLKSTNYDPLCALCFLRLTKPLCASLLATAGGSPAMSAKCENSRSHLRCARAGGPSAVPVKQAPLGRSGAR